MIIQQNLFQKNYDGVIFQGFSDFSLIFDYFFQSGFSKNIHLLILFKAILMKRGESELSN